MPIYMRKNGLKVQNSDGTWVSAGGVASTATEEDVIKNKNDIARMQNETSGILAQAKEYVDGILPTASVANADTVDGKHATDFITGDTLQQRTTIDDCTIGGTYAVSTTYTTDLPTEFGTWGIMDVRVYELGIFQVIYFTGTKNIIHRSKITNQIEWTPWKRINDGGNADTLNGLNAELIRSMSKNVDSGTSATSSQLADGTYCGTWADVPPYLSDTQGTLIVSNYHTNGAPSPWSHRIFYSPHYSTIWHGFIANYNWYGWEQISATPIKKMSFSSVATNAGGGGSLFSADFGTPITIACTSRRDTQCTSFYYEDGNQWLVLAKDAVTLDPIPGGSYSFDVWYI